MMVSMADSIKRLMKGSRRIGSGVAGRKTAVDIPPLRQTVGGNNRAPKGTSQVQCALFSEESSSRYDQRVSQVAAAQNLAGLSSAAGGSVIASCGRRKDGNGRVPRSLATRSLTLATPADQADLYRDNDRTAKGPVRGQSNSHRWRGPRQAALASEVARNVCVSLIERIRASPAGRSGHYRR